MREHTTREEPKGKERGKKKKGRYLVATGAYAVPELIDIFFFSGASAGGWPRLGDPMYIPDGGDWPSRPRPDD